jgi:chaperonin GroEL (HSP60 family)
LQKKLNYQITSKTLVLIRQAASKTNDVAGDGTTTTVLATQW